jgi:hypothetical protein
MWWTQGMSSPDYWARWQPSISMANQGMYKVDLHIPPNHATARQARYTINHAYGSTTAHVVQAALPHTGWPNST